MLTGPQQQLREERGELHAPATRGGTDQQRSSPAFFPPNEQQEKQFSQFPIWDSSVSHDHFWAVFTQLYEYIRKVLVSPSHLYGDSE